MGGGSRGRLRFLLLLLLEELLLYLLALVELLLLMLQDLLLLLHVLLFYLDQLLADLHAEIGVEFVVHHRLQYYGAHVVDARVGQALQSRHKVHQLGVVGRVVPAEDGDPILRLKLVGVRRGVDDQRVFEGPAHSLHIFHVHPVEVGAVLAEEALRCHLLLIEDVH